MIKKFLPLLLTLLVCASVCSFASVKDDPIMIRGVRPMGMGGAFTAVADDENAIFYNPAGIVNRTGKLLQFFNINLAVNSNTIDLGQDLSDTLSKLNSDGEDDKIDSLIKIKDAIADRDIDFTASLVNPVFISSPLSIGNNSLSFGLGIFDSVNVGIRAGMEIPKFALEFAKLAAQDIQNENDFLAALPDNMLNELGILNSGYNAADLRAAINSGQSWAQVSSTFLTQDVQDLIDNVQTIASSLMDDGDKYSAIKQELSDFANGQGAYLNSHGGIWSLDNASARATVNSYVSAEFNVPLAYKIKSLSALGIPGELSFGINLKYIQRAKFSQTIAIGNDEIEKLLNGTEISDVIDTKAGASYGSGFGVDIGMMYAFNPRLNFGLQVADAFTRIDYNKGYSIDKDKWADSDFTHKAYIDPQINIGAAYIPSSVLGFDLKDRLILAADIRDLTGSYEEDFGDKLHFGAEYRLFRCLAVRAGLNKLRPAIGAGLEFSFFQLSYAFYGEESYLARMIGDNDKTVYYHELLIAFKIGHLSGKKVDRESVAKNVSKTEIKEELKETAEQQQAKKDFSEPQETVQN
jgi:hypothetical protein